MKKLRYLATPLLLAFVQRAAIAQGISSKCPAGAAGSNDRIAQDACQKAIDLFQYMAPQLGALVAGGNPTQGVAGTVGGVGHFSVGIRGNALKASLPEVDKVVPATTGAINNTYSLDSKPFGLPTADVSIGILGGFPLGITSVGGVDLLVTGSYLPSYDNGSIKVEVPNGSLKLGYGVKLGLLKETLLVPGVSLSVVTRELPTVSLTGQSGNDRLMLDNLKVKTTTWRAVAGKTFLIFGVAGGFGKDFYDSNANISVTVAPRPGITPGGSGGPVALSQKLSRSNVFASAWFSARVLRIVGEIGRASGGEEIATFNQFQAGHRPNDARTYLSLGVNVGL